MAIELDIFDVGTIESVVRQIISEKKEINLRDYDLPSYTTPNNFEIKTSQFPKENYDISIRSSAKKLVKICEESGFNREKIYAALYETIKNAHQHGNMLNSEKKVTIAHDIRKGELDISIIDQGGVLKADFMSFVLYQRQMKQEKKFSSFYEFSQLPKPESNFGVGLILMHSYMDRVRFFKNEDGGLVVNLQKSIAVKS